MRETLPHLSDWGRDDRIGSANELSPAGLMRALQLPSSGRIIDLSHSISDQTPRMVGMSPYSLCMWTHPVPSQIALKAEGARNGVGFADERVEMDLHIGTHLDSLGHCWAGDRGYNRRLMLESVGNSGLVDLGIEHVPPIIARGVLIDVVSSRPGSLEAGSVISPTDLQRALETQGSSIEPGDVVLIRTGWGRFYGTDNDRYATTFPGLGLAAAEWLAEHRVTIVGSDTMALEVYPPESSDAPWAVHQFLLAGHGIYILENANLEEMALAERFTFLCACLPIKFRGGTASPVRLVAVV